ncbi:unnamed protein product [Ostreobium quekettii]|uniref:HAD family hydrolase n=1 Tax=Ostreobium quekettii TaxID=121088 RepID=A0A8S1ING7_9CHLO|nr:unnamed protein product [Ostreobium quekettii]
MAHPAIGPAAPEARPPATPCRHAAPKFGHSIGAGRRGRAMPAAAGPSDVFALDLDGVLVDSAPEIASTGYGTAAALWPDVFEGADDQSKERVKQELNKLRPLKTNGHEEVLMARLLMEAPQKASEIAEDWPAVHDAALADLGWTPDDLQAEFLKFREAQKAKDLAGWRRLNQPYPGIKETLMYCEFPFYIVTTKPPASAAGLLQDILGLSIPVDSPRLIAGLYPPGEAKARALRELGERPMCKEPGVRLHFVDDRPETVELMSTAEDMARWNLYFADW